MKQLIILFLVLILSSALCEAQVQFERTIGGTNSDYAWCVIQTTDGGFAVAGETASFGAGQNDFYIPKFDGTGNLQWSKTIGGIDYEGASSIIQTTDGGYALAGYTSSFGAGLSDMFIVKLSSSGALQWSKTVGGTGDDYAYSVIQTTDGGYAVAGETDLGGGGRNMYIVKLDASGSLQWSKTIGGAYDDNAWCIIQTTDLGFAVVGSTVSFGAVGNDMYIVKLDAQGILQWSMKVGGTGEDYARSIIETANGTYTVAGFTNSFGAGGFDMYIVKIDGNGMQWSRTVGGTGSDLANSLIQTTDGGFVAAGTTTSFGAGNYDMYMVKLSSSGTVQWSRTFGGAGIDLGRSIVRTTDGGFTVAGYTNSFGAGGLDMLITKYDSSGSTCGNYSSSPTSSQGTGGTLGNPTSTVTSQNSTVTSPTPTTSTGGTLTTLCTFVGIQPILNEIPGSYELHQNYPNPFNPTTKFRIEIAKLADTKVTVYDVLGKEVETLVNQQLQPGTYEVEWDATKYLSGVYFYKLNTGDYSATKKMVLVK